MKKRKRIKNDKSGRLTWVYITLVFIIFILIFRLSYIMIFKKSEYSAMAMEQWTNEVKIDAKRGKILDRNGTELAVSANVYRVDLDLNAIRKITDPKNSTKNKTTNKEIAEKIAPLVAMEKDEVLKKLELKLPSGAPAGSTTLIRRIEKSQADKVKELKISGVLVSPDTKRYYPNNNFLSHVLGNTNSDGIGLNGVELKYNDVLSGVPGVRISELDGKKKDFPYTTSRFTSPVDGKDVVLTIDEKIQYFAEKVAEKGLKEHTPEAITVMVMNPNNGEILALVNKPDFNPNKPNEGFEKFVGDTESAKIQKMWRNRAVSDTFEPGSIFKILTAAIALQEGIAGGNETYYCNGVGSYGMKCWDWAKGGHGTQTFDQILQHSCNVAFMDIGKKIGKEKFNEYLYKFGLGKKSGVDLPGEAPGVVKGVEDMSEMDLCSIAFGQTDTVNSVQFMTAMNSVINGGTLIQPHVMKEISHINDNGVRIVDNIFKPSKVENVITKETSQHLNKSLESVVSIGSAKKAYIAGYGIAGKTGTSEKVNPSTGTYGNGYVSSFAAFAPYDNPQISILISLDKPKGEHYGGLVAAPLAKDLFEDIFNYVDINHINLDKGKQQSNIVIPDIRGMKVEEAQKVLNDTGIQSTIEGTDSFIVDSNPKPGYKVKAGSKITLYTGSSSNYNKDVIVPDLEGYSKDEAKALLMKLKLKVSFEGIGNVVKQSINPGDVVKSGNTIKLTLDENKKE